MIYNSLYAYLSYSFTTPKKVEKIKHTYCQLFRKYNAEGCR